MAINHNPIVYFGTKTGFVLTVSAKDVENQCLTLTTKDPEIVRARLIIKAPNQRHPVFRHWLNTDTQHLITLSYRDNGGALTITPIDPPGFSYCHGDRWFMYLDRDGFPCFGTTSRASWESRYDDHAAEAVYQHAVNSRDNRIVISRPPIIWSSQKEILSNYVIM